MNDDKLFTLHEYASYEEYRDTQILHNKRKLTSTWADGNTLDIVSTKIEEYLKEDISFGLCHGSRNGFEQSFFKARLNCKVIGTDISDTASQFPDSIQWDFHEVNPKFVGKCDFVYSNSFDQSCNPEKAFTTWLGQLRVGGIMILEHTIGHEPSGASKMDPFGIKREYLPFYLSKIFGFQISIDMTEAIKPNIVSKSGKNYKVTFFFIRKNY